jgi:molybdate transport system substrate-binding protein
MSQVIAWTGDDGALWTVPQAYYQPIEQQAILLQRGAANEAAMAWMDFLQSGTAITIIQSYGYDLNNRKAD